MEKGGLFHKWCLGNWIYIYIYIYAKNLDSNFTPYTKINSKQIIDLYVRIETIKLLEKKHTIKIFVGLV